MNKLTDEEIALVNLLGDCWNAFVDLPMYHIQDGQEFMQGIHQLQEKVMARLAHRTHPEVFS